ncbi:hypothetical protein FRB99_007872 [Tulasnella sp. 403]|nr:hypothetical protein FRB99_007872 [Tulasnella sp. 403]
MAGDVGTEDRLLYTAAPAGTPASMMSRYTRVVYRFGWRGQGTHITVLFVMGAEVLAIAVQASAWGTMAASTWKQMILRHAPLAFVLPHRAVLPPWM